MEISSSPMPLTFSRPQIPSKNTSANYDLTQFLRKRWINRKISLNRYTPICAIDGDFSSDLSSVEINWQIAVGSIAGTMPFIVAGIEFGKRIMAQRRCGTCRGSGLVLREEFYSRCPTCGGFLPWQSWKRFFTG